MNKKDIAGIRSQFKLNNKRMSIREIYNVYVKKESGEIYHDVIQPFQLLEQETQELFLTNFKKVLTGNLDFKLFELKFTHDVPDSTQTILYDGLRASSTEDWGNEMLRMVEKMFAHSVYEFDTVVTFIRGEYRKSTRKRDAESEEGGDDEVYANEFILCSLNKTDQAKKALVFDYVEKEFRPTNDVDPIINLHAPLSGFLFPTFSDHGADVNHILYSAGKINDPNDSFIHEVLNCEEIITALEDKECFEQVLFEVVGEEIDPQVMSNVYEEIEKIVQDHEEAEEPEPAKLDTRDVERILTVSGVENLTPAKMEHVFKEVMNDEKHEFKAKNIVPKAIKIKTKVTDVSIKPHDLKYVQYIMHQGKRCLLLEIDDATVVEGLTLEAGQEE